MRPTFMRIKRPADPFQDRIDAAMAAKHTPPKSTAPDKVMERKRTAMIRSLERVLKMLKESRNG